MNKLRLVKIMSIIGISVLCAGGLAACSLDDLNPSGAVAAKVDGAEIYEKDVTDYVEGLRESYNLTDEEAWGTYLAQSNITPAQIRENVLEDFISRKLIEIHATDRGVSVDSSEVDDCVEQMKSNYDTDEAWQNALKQVGITEEKYRHEVELQLLNRHLLESFATDEAPNEDSRLQYAQMYASAYDGAKRSSHILFAKDDEALAQEVLNKINAGEMSFEDAAKEYSQDSASAVSGGDIGWDKSNRLVEEYQSALDVLQKDQMSGLVSSQYGIHIIKCTDVYAAPREADETGAEVVKITAADQLPAEWLDAIDASLKSQAQSDAYRQWVEGLRESADIVINDMPEDLPYNVDITKYQSAPPEEGAAPPEEGAAPEGEASEGEAPTDSGA